VVACELQIVERVVRVDECVPSVEFRVALIEQTVPPNTVRARVVFSFPARAA